MTKQEKFREMVLQEAKNVKQKTKGKVIKKKLNPNKIIFLKNCEILGSETTEDYDSINDQKFQFHKGKSLADEWGGSSFDECYIDEKEIHVEARYEMDGDGFESEEIAIIGIGIPLNLVKIL